MSRMTNTAAHLLGRAICMLIIRGVTLGLPVLLLLAVCFG
jgi:hypothetical protein